MRRTNKGSSASTVDNHGESVKWPVVKAETGPSMSFLTLHSGSVMVHAMDTGNTPPSAPVEAAATQSEWTTAPALLDDDLDLGDVQLEPRQKGVAQEIVCEGGCE